MIDLAAARAHLAQLLTDAGVAPVALDPAQLVPPCVLVDQADDVELIALDGSRVRATVPVLVLGAAGNPAHDTWVEATAVPVAVALSARTLQRAAYEISATAALYGYRALCTLTITADAVPLVDDEDLDEHRPDLDPDPDLEGTPP